MGVSITARRVSRRIDREVPGGVKWIEEFLPPDDYDGHKAVYDAVGGTTLLTTGEHEYTRWGYRQLLERKCVNVLQPDISWVGGITEARRVVALASAYDVMVIPHGSSVYSYHLQYAFANCPIAEFLVLSPAADKIVPLFGAIFTDEPLPKDGYIDLDDSKPGFGVTLNKAGVVLTRPYAHTPLTYEQAEAAKTARLTPHTEASDIPMNVELTVNGKTQSVQCEDRTLLVDLLREQLGLTGTHVGCDTSQCGCCTVHLDGQAVKSCSMLAVQAQGARITTIEGMASGDTLHPVQLAFSACHGLQCGFCTPGMIMASADLLRRHPDPTDDQIREGLAGNICRCTGYVNIVAAVKTAAKMIQQAPANRA
jgi:aerobic-type carbon monoxide dehydrogenase small subunit (CoxS/CutS family)